MYSYYKLMKAVVRMLLCCAASAVLSSCAPAPKHAAPVIDEWQQARAQRETYVVQKDDTIHSIARSFGMDVHDLIKANHLAAPYKLHPGQKLQLLKARPSMAQDSAVTAKKNEWLWPTPGKIIEEFSGAGDIGNKGIDIEGANDAPVVASHAGKVIYAGAGLSSYGNLIIIKHNKTLSSAYGYNRRLLVAEGQKVKAGQQIAKMGTNSAGVAILHFEMRANGKPVDPRAYLPKSEVHTPS